MEGRRLLGGLSLCLLLSSVTADNTLKNLEDLRNIPDLIKEFPRHGLLLLHWFANNVEVDPSGAIELRFELSHGSYGSCRPSNKISGTPPDGQFYSLGDLSQKSSRMFPFYVVQDFQNSEGFPLSNVDRLLIQLKNGRSTQVEKVYLTEDRGQQNQETWRTQMENAYEISPLLLFEIQELDKDVGCDAKDFRMKLDLCQFLDLQQKAAKVLAVYPRTAGLDWFLALSGYDVDQRIEVFTQQWFCSSNQTDQSRNPDCNRNALSVDSFDHHKVNLQVKSTSEGSARVVWNGLPESVARTEIYVGLHKDGATAEPLKEFPLNGRTYGAVDTPVPLNPGLQVRLFRKVKTSYLYFFRSTSRTTIWKGPELDGANGVPPTTIRGYQASLQLYAQDGYACARLYIRRSFSQWKNVFDFSWVGFYTRKDADNNKYDTYAWSIKFHQKPGGDCSSDYDVYEYESNMYVSPGAQARFMLTKHQGSEKARTVPWEE